MPHNWNSVQLDKLVEQLREADLTDSQRELLGDLLDVASEALDPQGNDDVVQAFIAAFEPEPAAGAGNGYGDGGDDAVVAGDGAGDADDGDGAVPAPVPAPPPKGVGTSIRAACYGIRH